MINTGAECQKKFKHHLEPWKTKNVSGTTVLKDRTTAACLPCWIQVLIDLCEVWHKEITSHLLPIYTHYCEHQRAFTDRQDTLQSDLGFCHWALTKIEKSYSSVFFLVCLLFFPWVCFKPSRNFSKTVCYFGQQQNSIESIPVNQSTKKTNERTHQKQCTVSGIDENNNSYNVKTVAHS